MIEFEKTKSLPITKEMVWEAYLQVRRKGKSAGVDELDMSEYDLQRHRRLYKGLEPSGLRQLLPTTRKLHCKPKKVKYWKEQKAHRKVG